jgi:pyruvate/2-oxoglutarate dehydrogenase complex dihydrolipoamide dehydrogenase (E3) component
MEHTETVVVGAGPAGRAPAVHHQQRGRTSGVRDPNPRGGDNRRPQWVSRKR